jgi:hypothetical protein
MSLDSGSEGCALSQSFGDEVELLEYLYSLGLEPL